MRLRFLRRLLPASCLLTAVASATVAVYPSPDDSFRSPAYTVTVIQDGVAHPSFTYVHAHQDPELMDRMSDFNHWTTFSFDGVVTVEVRAADVPVAGTTIRPTARAISPAFDATDPHVLRFTLTRPGQFWVRIPGTEENPLFIFADPPEVDIPARDDPAVIWFEAGRVHDIGERFTISAGQTVYIPGGAYVKGTITAEAASHVTVRGRGILSGLGYARRPSAKGIPYNSIMFNGPGQDQLVEGITITNPPHFCILSRGQLTARRVKLFGWWHQTDGWGAGDGSVVEDSFMKVNDDSVKLYGARQTARRLVLYQQINGAPFQLGWGGAGQAARDCVVEDIDLIACEAATKTQREANQAFLNLRNQAADSTIDGVTLRRIRIDDDIAMLVGLIQVKGTVRNLHFADVTLRGQVHGANFIRTEGAGSVAGLSLEQVTVAGRLLTSPADAALRWATTGEVAPIQILP